jgi:NAD(P)H-dependent flavin oxidoreductase YrpB (nitropropane dioxygenase family)
MTFLHMLSVFFKALKEDPAELSQTVMAANQPVLLQHSMVDGHPDQGILPSGQVAAAIDELVSAEQLIHGIAEEAEQCLNRLYQENANHFIYMHKEVS